MHEDGGRHVPRCEWWKIGFGQLLHILLDGLDRAITAFQGRVTSHVRAAVVSAADEARVNGDTSDWDQMHAAGMDVVETVYDLTEERRLNAPLPGNDRSARQPQPAAAGATHDLPYEPDPSGKTFAEAFRENFIGRGMTREQADALVAETIPADMRDAPAPANIGPMLDTINIPESEF